MTNQVPVVGILMIINGALTCLMGAMLAFIGPAFLTIFKDAEHMRAEDKEIITVIFIVYFVVGIVLLIAGILNIVGGIRALKYKSRGLVLTAIFFNLIPVFTVYCTATSLGLLIYGLIVMFNREVGQAFAMGASGMSAEQIRNQLDRHRLQLYDTRRDESEYRWSEEQRPPPSSTGRDETGFYEK